MTSPLSCKPARVLHQDNLPLRTNTNSLCKVCQRNTENLDVHRREQPPVACSCFGEKKSIHVKPFIPLLDTDDRMMALLCPDAPDDRFQAHAMLIHRDIRSTWA